MHNKPTNIIIMENQIITNLEIVSGLLTTDFDENTEEFYKTFEEFLQSTKSTHFEKYRIDILDRDNYTETWSSVLNSQAMLFTILEIMQNIYFQIYCEKVVIAQMCYYDPLVADIVRNTLSNLRKNSDFERYFNNTNCDESYIRSYFTANIEKK